MREHYRNNEEYRTQSLKDKKEKYYNKKYGMSFEEYTKMKQQEQDDFIKNNKEAFDKLVKKEEQILDSETKQKHIIDKEKRAMWARRLYYRKKHGMTEEEYKDKIHKDKIEEEERIKHKYAHKLIPNQIVVN